MRYRRAIARWINREIDAEETGAHTDADVLKQRRQRVDACVAGRVAQCDEWIADVWQLDLLQRDHVIALQEKQAIAAEREKIDCSERARPAQVRKSLCRRANIARRKHTVPRKGESLTAKRWELQTSVEYRLCE